MSGKLLRLYSPLLIMVLYRQWWLVVTLELSFQLKKSPCCRCHSFFFFNALILNHCIFVIVLGLQSDHSIICRTLGFQFLTGFEIASRSSSATIFVLFMLLWIELIFSPACHLFVACFHLPIMSVMKKFQV